jgi:hypothetical protein
MEPLAQDPERKLLKKMAVDLANFIVVLLEYLPDEIRTHENTIKMLEISHRIIDAYGPSVSTSNNSK